MGNIQDITIFRSRETVWFKVIILMAAVPCLAGELELSGHGLGDHGLTLGEIAVGHEGGDIGLEEIGLLNVYTYLVGFRATM